MSEPGRRPRVSGRAIRIALRLTGPALLLFGPIVIAAWHVRMDAASGLDNSPNLSENRQIAGKDADEVREYLARRNPAVDRLLPAGAGGTRFVKELDGNAGMAFIARAAIALTPSVAADPWRESTELHERAHLIVAFLPREVARVMARMPPPHPDEYAARNRDEHFAEMAAEAWQIVVPPDGMCLEATAEERLTEAEARVPGTAGFVERYLRDSKLGEPARRDALVARATRLSASQHEEWNTLWRALDTRRLADGTFRPWAHDTVRGFIERQRLAAQVRGTWSDRFVDVGLVPSLWVLTATGR